MNFPEAKEYVQQQLQLMGVGEISQKELERYTRGKVIRLTKLNPFFSDFIQLLKEKETTNKFEEESVEDTSDDSESTTSLYHVAKQQATPTPDKVVEVSVSRVDGKVIKRKTLRYYKEETLIHLIIFVIGRRSDLSWKRRKISQQTFTDPAHPKTSARKASHRPSSHVSVT